MRNIEFLYTFILLYVFVNTEQGSANYSLWTDFSPLLVFVNKTLLEHRDVRLFTHYLCYFCTVMVKFSCNGDFLRSTKNIYYLVLNGKSLPTQYCTTLKCLRGGMRTRLQKPHINWGSESQHLCNLRNRFLVRKTSVFYMWKCYE